MEVNTTSKNLLFTTVRITCQMAAGVGSGTGFILDIGFGDDHVPVLVTNKHVVRGASQVVLHFVARQGGENKPDLGQHFSIPFDPTKMPFVGHPDPSIDIAAIPLVPIWGTHESKLFYRVLSMADLPDTEQGQKFDALEEVTFVGYPNGQSDPLHQTPIVRRGITATPMVLPFAGRPVFLVDGSVFGGSSGSPVFIYNSGSYSDGTGGIVIGNRCILVGIMAETMVRNSELPLEVSTAPHTKMAQELNLGVAYAWNAIAETVEEVRRHYGVAPKQPS